VSDDGDQQRNGLIPPSQAIPEAVADAVGCEITDLPPLYDVVDPDALDDVFADRDAGTVSFCYSDHRITVTETGEIEISE
jgi:hypothetical protein